MKTDKIMVLLKIVLVFTLFKEASSITLADKQITLTMYAYGVSWNRAQATCSHNGGALFTDDSLERRTVLTSFSQTWPNHHLWIGLHYPSTESNSYYGWTDCFGQNLLSFDNWKGGHPGDPNEERCVFSDKNSGEWKSKSCEEDSRFVCQNKDGPCTFTSGTGIPSPLSDVETINATAADLNGCLRQCLNLIYNFKNCWAVNYENTMCTFYFTTDPFLFDTHPMISSSASFHIKLCYNNNGTISTDDTSIIDTDSSNPISDCVTFNQQTTPSAFVPTTISTSSTTSTTATTTSSISVLTSTSTSNTTSQAISSTTSTTASPTLTRSLSSSTTARTTPLLSPTTTQTSTVISRSTTTSPVLTTSTTAMTTVLTTASSFYTISQTNISTSSPTRTASTNSPTTSSIASPITAISTTATISTNTPIPSTPCWCKCISVASETSNSTLLQKVESIKSRLQIDTRTLSSSIRKKTSANDDRSSSQTIGLAALSMIFLEVFVIVMADFLNVVKCFHKKFTERQSTGKPELHTRTNKIHDNYNAVITG